MSFDFFLKGELSGESNKNLNNTETEATKFIWNDVLDDIIEYFKLIDSCESD